MKGRVIVIDMPGEERFAAALVEDGRLQDLIVDPPSGKEAPRPGAIHMARITRNLPGAGGAFCALPGAEGYLRQAKGLKTGDTLMVQVVSVPEAGKAATVTSRVLFKGPRLILTPHAPGINVSRQIRDDTEAARLKAIATDALAALGDHGDAGLIVRTSAVGETEERLQAELGCLVAHYRRVQDGDAVAERYDAMSAALTEWLFPLPVQVLCAPGAAEILSQPGPPRGARDGWGDDRIPALVQAQNDPFAAFDLHDELRRLKRTEVPLQSGSMFIEATRAVIAVDVNTGSDFSPAAGLKTNLAVARDLPRQLRLRGLGGQIVVDFAPMPKQHRRTLEETLRKAFRDDPVETALVGWTSLGLYEIQRKRERRPLSEVI